MRKSHLEAALGAVAQASGQSELVLVGSQSIIKRIETFPDLNQRAVLLARLRMSSEGLP